MRTSINVQNFFSLKNNITPVLGEDNFTLKIQFLIRLYLYYISYGHTAIENLSDPIGYLLDFTNPYYTALAGNMKARAKKDNSF
jgi:hypothetical protein